MEHDDAPQQPWLHDLSLTLAAPTQVWSAADGQIGSGAWRACTTASGGC